MKFFKTNASKINKDPQRMKISSMWDNDEESVQEMYDKWEIQVMKKTTRLSGEQQ